MSKRDLQRIEVLTGVLAGRRTTESAAGVLNVSLRQAQRLLARYEDDGGGGALIHQARDRGSNNQLDAGVHEIAQTNGLHGMMESFIAEAADPQRVQAMREALNHLSEVKDREFVASLYIAATVPGEKYKGVLYGQNGRDFIMRTNDSKLIVGHAVDLPRGVQGAQAIELTATDGHKASISPDLPGGKRAWLEQFVETARIFLPFWLLPFLFFPYFYKAAAEGWRDVGDASVFQGAV